MVWVDTAWIPPLGYHLSAGTQNVVRKVVRTEMDISAMRTRLSGLTISAAVQSCFDGEDAELFLMQPTDSVWGMRLRAWPAVPRPARALELDDPAWKVYLYT